MPESLRRCIRSHQRACYAALFDAASQTIVELASKKKFVGTGRMGFFGVLHTWGRDFTVYNPRPHELPFDTLRSTNRLRSVGYGLGWLSIVLLIEAMFYALSVTT